MYVATTLHKYLGWQATYFSSYSIVYIAATLHNYLAAKLLTLVATVYVAGFAPQLISCQAAYFSSYSRCSCYAPQPFSCQAIFTMLQYIYIAATLHN